MAVARVFNKLLFRTRRFFVYPYLIIDSLLYLKVLICISTVHLYRPLCLTISSLTCSALGCLMNMWTFRPPARWAHGLLRWPRTAITNVVSCLVKKLSLFLYCLSEIKFTTTTTFSPGFLLLETRKSSWLWYDIYVIFSSHWTALGWISLRITNPSIMLFLKWISNLIWEFRVITVQDWWNVSWEVLYQKQVSRAETSNHILQMIWDAITSPSPW